MFRAVTKYAGKFKSLFEVIFQNTTTAAFTITSEGMFLEQFTTQNLLISVFLPADRFEEYVFEDTQPLHLGLGQNINKEFFKSIKNKDVITLAVNKPHIFSFEKDNGNSVQLLEVSTEDIQNIDPVKKEEYIVEPVDITTTDFNQMCRSFNSFNIDVVKNSGRIQISSNTEISVKTIKLGKVDPKDTDLIHQTYTAEQFSRINKISSFATEISIYCEKDKPLYFLCQSPIGVMKIYMYVRPRDE